MVFLWLGYLLYFYLRLHCASEGESLFKMELATDG